MDKTKVLWQRPVRQNRGRSGAPDYFGRGRRRRLLSHQTPAPAAHRLSSQRTRGAGCPSVFIVIRGTNGPVAGLPTTNRCWSCHQQIQQESPELDKLASYVQQGESIPWVPVAIEPDFVHFNHRPHIAAGINCETCHGDVSQMEVAVPQPDQDMGWCLECHQKMAPDKFVQLSDCSTCHY